MKTPIIIGSHTAQRWLYKLGYEYKDVHKDVLIDGYEKSDIIEDRKVFLNKIEELKPYIVEFDEDGVIKPKVCPFDCAIEGNNQQLLIVITHNKYTFFTNDRIQKVWARKSDTFLRPKG